MTETARLLNPALRTTIIVGVDTSPSAVAAAGFAQSLAHRTGASCHLVHVVAPGLDLFSEGTRVRRALKDARPQVDTAMLEIREGMVVDALLARAAKLDAGLIILGGKEHSLVGRWVAGSTAVDMVRRSPVPVLVTRGAVRPITRILAGADATPAAFGAIRHAEQWADLWDARLRVIHAVEVPPFLPEFSGVYGIEALRVQGEEESRRAVFPLIGRKDTEKVIDVGNASTVLSEQARYWQADLLVVARHDRSALDRFFLGSVTERLLDGLPTSILVVPAATDGAGAGEPVAAAGVPAWHA